MDENKTEDEPRLDEDLPVEDESAEQVTGGHRGKHEGHHRGRHNTK